MPPPPARRRLRRVRRISSTHPYLPSIDITITSSRKQPRLRKPLNRHMCIRITLYQRMSRRSLRHQRPCARKRCQHLFRRRNNINCRRNSRKSISRIRNPLVCRHLMVRPRLRILPGLPSMMPSPMRLFHWGLKIRVDAKRSHRLNWIRPLRSVTSLQPQRQSLGQHRR